MYPEQESYQHTGLERMVNNIRDAAAQHHERRIRDEDESSRAPQYAEPRRILE